VWSGPMAGLIGIDGVRVPLSGVPGGPIELKIAVNGVESNTVVLPVQ